MNYKRAFVRSASIILLFVLSQLSFAQNQDAPEEQELQFKARGIIQAIEEQSGSEPIETYENDDNATDEESKLVTFDVQMINFEFASFTLTELAKRQVDEFGMALSSEKLSEVTLTIVGHTDDRGSETYNQRLSEQRAASVAVYLRDQFSVPEARLTVVGEGESMPLIADTSSEARAQNRRVEMTFVLP